MWKTTRARAPPDGRETTDRVRAELEQLRTEHHAEVAELRREAAERTALRREAAEQIATRPGPDRRATLQGRTRSPRILSSRRRPPVSHRPRRTC
jgi:transcription elongation GreA/GreB family factor